MFEMHCHNIQQLMIFGEACLKNVLTAVFMINVAFSSFHGMDMVTDRETDMNLRILVMHYVPITIQRTNYVSIVLQKESRHFHKTFIRLLILGWSSRLGQQPPYKLGSNKCHVQKSKVARYFQSNWPTSRLWETSAKRNMTSSQSR